MNRYNRRKFVKTGMAGAAGVMTFSPALSSGLKTGRENDIIFRTLGKTNLKVPVVSFGVMRADSPGLCKAAYDSGMKLFDTANGYQNGNNETMLGNVFKNITRNSFILQTKVKAAGVGRDGLPSSQTTSEDFLDKFHTSLSRLQMEYVDTLLIHDVSNPAFLEHKPVLNALDKLKQQKKVRFVGFSTHGNMAEVITAAAATGRWDVIVTSYNFKLSNPEEMNAALHKANEAGIGIIAMKTLAGGGFLDKERTKPINSAAAIKWVLSNPDVHTVIAGMTTFDHLDSNKKILSDITLTNKEKEDILIAGNETGMFCTGCQKCLGNCRQNLPVPDLMRAYMYAYGYSSPQMAYALMGELGTGSSPCINCDICSVDCTKKFNVKERISDVSRLVNVPSDFIV